MTSDVCKRIATIGAACLLATVLGTGSAATAHGPTAWRTAYLTQSALLDIALSGDDNVWTLGEGGAILHYDGTSWAKAHSPTEETLHAVALTTPDQGWAVGDAGTILRLTDGEWHPASAPTSGADELFDIALTAEDGWAVGQRFDEVAGEFGGLILHLSDGVWTETPIPKTNPLRAIYMMTANDGWAVGQNGAILHWDGTQWTAETRPTNVDLYDVTVVRDDIWAAGESGVLVRWDAEGSHVILTPHEADLAAIGFAAPEAGWSVGEDGTVLHYEDGTWIVRDTPLDADLAGLAVDASGVPWVTGDGGLIAQVTPSGWEFNVQPYVDVDVTAVEMLDDSAGWAAGGWPLQPDDGAIFWQRSGAIWSPRWLDHAPPLFDIDVVSADEAWAVGGQPPPSTEGIIWHYTDNSWAGVNHEDVSALFAVDAVAPYDVWVAGLDGSLIHFDGNAWSNSSVIEPNVHLYGLHFRTADDGWAVGEELDLTSEPPRYLPVALHYDGNEWTFTEVPDTAWSDTTDSTLRPRLLGVYALADSDVWAVGNAGAILHYDGSDWTVIQGLQFVSLLDVDFAGPGDGWAVGTEGTILRYEDGGWSSTDSPTTETLNAVVSRPWGEAWAGGSNGTFLYHPAAHLRTTYMPFLTR